MKKEIFNLKLATVAKHNNKYYLTALKLNALFVYDPQIKKLCYLDSFQIERAVCCMYVRSFVYKEEIWFLPAEAEKIAVLNTQNMNIEYIPIDFNGEYCDTEIKYNNYVIYNKHYVCFVPRGVKEAVFVNMKTKKIESYYQISTQNERFQNAVLLNHTLHFYPWRGCRKVSVNLDSGELGYEEWKNNENYGDAAYDITSGNIFHAPARNNHVLIDDIHGNELEKETLKLPSNDAGYHSFYSSFYGEEILFWGTKGVISVNPREHNIQYFQIREDIDEIILFPIDFPAKEAFEFGGNKIFRYDDTHNKYISINVTIMFEELMKQLRKLGKDFYDIHKYTEFDCEEENDPLTLNSFIYLIKSNLLTKCKQNYIKEYKKPIQDFSNLLDL